MATPQTFGSLLRSCRQQASKTLGDVARHISVSVSFVADVEHDRRNPLKPEQIIACARLFGIDSTALLAAAAKQRGGVTVTPRDASRMDIVVGLARSIDDLSEAQLAKIRAALEEDDE
jgi:transcriptional regulator with XRE-family HTH domain